MHFDSDVAEAKLQGRAPVDLAPDAAAVAAIRDLAQTLARSAERGARNKDGEQTAAGG